MRQKLGGMPDMIWSLVLGISIASGLVVVPTNSRLKITSPRLRDTALCGTGFEEVLNLATVEQWAPNVQIAALQAATSLFASIFGFGDAILAMPLLGLLFGLDARQAAPLVTCVSTLMIVANLVVDIRSGKMSGVGRWNESGALLVGAIAGVPVGVNALVSLDPDLLRTGVGVLLIAYAVRELNKPTQTIQETKDLQSLLTVIPFGFAAGILGGAVAEPGPPAVVLGQTRRWDPQTMRVMLFRFFLPVQLISLFDLNEAGLLTSNVVLQALAAAPGVVAAVAVGTVLNRKIDPTLFSSLVATLVLCLGFLCCSSAAPKLLASAEAHQVFGGLWTVDFQPTLSPLLLSDDVSSAPVAFSAAIVESLPPPL